MAVRVPIVSEFNPKGVTEAERSLQRFAAKAGVDLGKAAAGLGILAGAGYKAFKELDSGFDAISTGTGATGRDFEKLKQTALDALGQVPNSFAEVGQAVADFNTRLGLTGKELEEASVQALNLSRLTGSDLQGNIRSVSRVVRDWGLDTSETSATLDLLFAASQRTGIEVQRLGELVVQFGAPMRQLGFEFEEAVGLLAQFEQQGVNTETVMSGLRIALANFAQAGDDPKAALRAVITEIRTAGTVAAGNSRAIEVFGKKAGADMAAAIREGRFEIDDFVASLQNSEGAISDAERAARSFDDTLQILKNQALRALAPELENTTERLDSILGVLERIKALDFASEVLSWSNPFNWFSKVPELVRDSIPAIEDFQGSAEELRAELERKGFTLEQIERLMEGFRSATADTAPVVDDLASTTEDAAESTRDLATAQRDAAKAADELRRRQERQIDAARAASDSTYRTERSLRDAEAAAWDYVAVALDAESSDRDRAIAAGEAASAYKDYAADVAQSMSDQREALGLTALTAQEKAAIQIEELSKVAQTLSPTDPLRRNLEDYIGRLLAVPGVVSSYVELDTAEAERRLTALERRLRILADPNADVGQSAIVGNQSPPPPPPPPADPSTAGFSGRVVQNTVNIAGIVDPSMAQQIAYEIDWMMRGSE